MNVALGTLGDVPGPSIDRTHKMDPIVESFRSRQAAGGAAGALDDRTWQDLHLDDVFAACDRTASTLGQHALYYRLRSAPTGAHIGAFEALVTRMSDDPAARERAQRLLSRLQDRDGYDLWWMAGADVVERKPAHIIFPVLALATLAVLAGLVFAPPLFPVLLLMLMANAATRYRLDDRTRDAAEAFRQIAPIVATGQSLAFLANEETAPIVGPLVADAPKLRRLKTISRWVCGDPFMLSVNPSPLAGLITQFVMIVYDYANYVFLLDANGVFFGAAELRLRAPALLGVLAAIGDVDAAIAVASYRAGRSDWTRPRTLPPGAHATFAGLRHPLVENAVPNSIDIAAGRGVLVTGSNMSGKSTFLRTVAVNVVLAQTINTCLAADYAAPVFHVRSSIGRSDDLIAGKSYYLVEVESLIDLLRASDSDAPHLFVLDELFRGTNAVERIAAGQAVLRALLSDGRRHVVLAATHDGELVDLLPDVFDVVHFGDALTEQGLTFDHRLLAGPATSRNAIALLKLSGAPERVVRDAADCASALDRARAGTTHLARPASEPG